MNALLTVEDVEAFQCLVDDAAVMKVALTRDACAASLYAFVKQAWDIVEPLKPFVPNWHIERLCAVLEDVYRGKIKRLIINVPPGTAKSLIINVFFPAWVWALNDRKRFLCASFSAGLTMRDNLRCRELIESEWYQARWPVKLSEDQNAKSRYNTVHRGWRIATSVNGQGMGEHPDFILIDDPTSAMEAESDVELANANLWYDRTISQRLGRNPAIIVIMQRLHKDDLSGHLLKRGGWEHVRWPMRFEACTCPTDTNGPLNPEQLCPLHKADPDWVPDKRDPRKEPGELLFPAYFNEAQVANRELDLGAYGTAGQLQQRPSPVGGKIFKREWFLKFVDIAPKTMRMARGWDTAATEGAGDSTASVKIGESFEYVLEPAAGTKPAKRVLKSTGTFYLMDPINEKLGPSGVDALIKATAALDGKDVAQREEREGGSAGKTVIEARTKTLKGFNYAGVPISGSKTTRAKPFRAQCEAGNVLLVGPPSRWEAYIRELCDFSGDGSGHDDYVDASSAAFNSVLLEEPPAKVKITW